MYTLPHSQGILHTTPSCFRGSLGRTKCDLSVVSDLKTDPTCTPFCCRQRRSGSDKPLMYGSRTAVDLISVAGSISEMPAGSWIL